MVSTHPDHRRRGFAAQTVAAAGKFAAETYRTKTLVIVADPKYHAISIYRDLGFVVTEQQVSIERRAETDA
jgi:ribosomal protein S18 acetylase RimI-like enzyme